MPFWSLCESDPLVKLIRETYGATPLKIPDGRFAPLTLLATPNRRVMYIGGLAELAPPTWSKPRLDTIDMPSVTATQSRDLSWGVAIDLVGPFVAQLLGIAQVEVEASIKRSQHKGQTVRLSIGRAKRTFVQLIALARSIETIPLKLPSSLDDELGRAGLKSLYLVDSVLTAAEITLGVEGSSAAETAAKLSADIAGKASADAVIRATSTLTITGTKRHPFAFTSVPVTVDSSGVISSLGVADQLRIAGATGVGAFGSPAYEALGERNELVAFDD